MPVVAKEKTQPDTGHRITVDIADLAVTGRDEDILVTYSLGSCIGVTLYDPKERIGGMIHCMLPLSQIEPERAVERPCLFVDTGVPVLLDELGKAGVRRKNLVAMVAGCAAPRSGVANFAIGERNYEALRELLQKNGIPITNEKTGGSAAMTMYLYMSTGETWVKVGDKEILL